MKIVILEDEEIAYAELVRQLLLINPGFTIEPQIESVADAVAYFTTNKAPDLIFSDIQLGDGLTFEIFNQIKIKSPIIFTTAYDKHALRAFKLNSVDYLLKPVDNTELRHALEKYEITFADSKNQTLNKLVERLSTTYKSRLLIHNGSKITIVDVKDVSCFEADNVAQYCYTNEGKKFLVDHTIRDLQQLLDPSLFFRISRKHLIKAQSIAEIENYFNGRLILKMQGCPSNEIIVARERVKDFKAWLADA